MTKGPHADIYVGARKVAEARLGDNGQWFRWGDLVTDNKLLRQTDQVISNMSTNTAIMNEARSHVRQVLSEAQQILTHAKPNSPIYQQAQRALPRFTNLLELIK